MVDRAIVGTIIAFAVVGGLRGMSAGQEPGAQADATFTGEIKPVLYVSDVQASAEYFEEVFGFGFDGFANRDDGTPYYAEMLAGDRKFGLHEPTVDGQETRVGQARLYFRVEDAGAHRQRVVAAGGEPGGMIETAWMDFFIARDPDGHEIVFAVTDPDRHTIDPW